MPYYSFRRRIRQTGCSNLSKVSVLPYSVNLKDRNRHVGSDKNRHKCPGAAEQLSELQASFYLEENHLSGTGRLTGANRNNVI